MKILAPGAICSGFTADGKNDRIFVSFRLF
jgi:hypothetical protein